MSRGAISRLKHQPGIQQEPKLLQGLLHDRKAELRSKDVQDNLYPIKWSVWLNEAILEVVLNAFVDKEEAA